MKMREIELCCTPARFAIRARAFGLQLSHAGEYSYAPFWNHYGDLIGPNIDAITINIGGNNRGVINASWAGPNRTTLIVDPQDAPLEEIDPLLTKLVDELQRLGLIDNAVRLVHAPAVGQQLAAGPDAEASPPPSQNVFRKTGDGYIVAFKGSAPQPAKNLKGMYYIAQLIGSPGRYFDASELCAAVRYDGAKSASLDWDDASELHDNSSSDGYAVADKPAMADYRRLLLEIQKERALVDPNDAAEMNRLDREVEQIEAHRQQSQGIGGRPREFSDEREKARQAVRAAIGYAVKGLGKKNADLAAHLNNYIECGGKLVYNPREPVAWETGRKLV